MPAQGPPAATPLRIRTRRHARLGPPASRRVRPAGGPASLPAMHLSKRVQALKPSATLAVNQRAAELRAAGVDVLSFAAGEPDFDTPPVVCDAAVESLRAGATKYGPVPGSPDAREAIADKLRRENNIAGVTADHVVVSSGGKHSLYQLFQALLDPPEAPGDEPQEVVLPVPAWVSYRPQIELAGGAVREVVTTADRDFKVPPDDLRAALNPRTRAVVLNSPSNPCGTMYTPDEIRALARVLADAAADGTAPHCVLVSDELYDKITYGGIDHLSPASIPEIAERTVTVNGLSKAYAMTGWRIGYLAGTGDFGLEVAKGVRKLQSQSTTSVPTFFNAAIRAAITGADADARRMRDAFAARAAIAHEGIGAIPGFVCPRPTGAFYLFPDVSAHFGKRSAGGRSIDSAMDFAGALLDEHHVAVVPGEDFGTGGERCFRFSFACGEQQIRAGLERIGAFVRELA